MIFDLDGTLVQTERLKAISYAKAAVELCPHELDLEMVIEAFKDVVGRSRREVSTTLMERFDLEERTRALQGEMGLSAPWQAFVQVRLRIYEEMISDPRVLQENQWPHNIDLLVRVQQRGCRVALATMSDCERARHVLRVLGLLDAFEFIATRDDVENGKPDPEIYQLVGHELALPPADCLVIEDSPSGVEAALRAGMHCVAVSTPFTQQRLHESGLLADRWIVDDHTQVIRVVEQQIEEINAHG